MEADEEVGDDQPLCQTDTCRQIQTNDCILERKSVDRKTTATSLCTAVLYVPAMVGM